MRSLVASKAPDLDADRTHERGYALVSLLALMTILALFALTVVPRAQQQAQREWEKEALFRGDQVSEAIRAYYRSRGGQGLNSLPTSMDQLLEGVQIPGRTKRLQVLRPSAARDPLSEDGEWRLISPTSEDFAGFVQNLMAYTGAPPPPRPEFAGLANVIPRMTSVLGTSSVTSGTAGGLTSQDASGPFVGVGSRSQRDSVITYFGIDRHDQWIFTPVFR